MYPTILVAKGTPSFHRRRNEALQTLGYIEAQTYTTAGRSKQGAGCSQTGFFLLNISQITCTQKVLQGTKPQDAKQTQGVGFSPRTLWPT